jgi:hypothetical protein
LLNSLRWVVALIVRRGVLVRPTGTVMHCTESLTDSLIDSVDVFF